MRGASCDQNCTQAEASKRNRTRPPFLKALSLSGVRFHQQLFAECPLCDRCCVGDLERRAKGGACLLEAHGLTDGAGGGDTPTIRDCNLQSSADASPSLVSPHHSRHSRSVPKASSVPTCPPVLMTIAAVSEGHGLRSNICVSWRCPMLCCNPGQETDLVASLSSPSPASLGGC